MPETRYQIGDLVWLKEMPDEKLEDFTWPHQQGTIKDIVPNKDNEEELLYMIRVPDNEPGQEGEAETLLCTEETIEGFAPGEAILAIHVPLVHNSAKEISQIHSQISKALSSSKLRFYIGESTEVIT